MAIKLITCTFIGALFIFLIWSSSHYERFELKGLVDSPPYGLVLYDKETGDLQRLILRKVDNTKKIDPLHEPIPQESRPIDEWLKQDHPKISVGIDEELDRDYFSETDSAQFVQHDLSNSDF